MARTYETIKAPFPQEIADIVKQIGSRKRTVVVVTEPAGVPEALYSYWDGGSRDEYRAWNTKGQPINLPISGAPQFTQQQPKWVSQSGDVLVNYGSFCGKPMVPRITFYE
jgi:hypothetical protein